MFKDNKNLQNIINKTLIEEADFPPALGEKELLKSYKEKTPFHAVPNQVDSEGNIYFSIGGIDAVMPAAECDCYKGGRAAMSRLNRPTCFVCVKCPTKENPEYILSRTMVQKQYISEVLNEKPIGSVIYCKIVAFARSIAYCDIGCGVTSIIPVANMSINRIKTPEDRFERWSIIPAIIKERDSDERIVLSTKELLGTWEENANTFQEGRIVVGVVRDIEPYGAFIELTPNLAGLVNEVDAKNLKYGDVVLVHINTINPVRQKIKLSLEGNSDAKIRFTPLNFNVPENKVVTGWRFNDKTM